MMMNTKERFTEAENFWDLERLYTDLGKAKGKPLTAKEKLYLRGLLCGYGPAEMAKKCHKSANGLKVHLSKTLYQYVKVLVNKENDKLENWTNIREWLEEIGYKRSQQSFSLDDKNLLNLNGDNNTLCQNVNSPSTGQTELQHELEKAQLMIEQRDKENELLRQQVSDLREKVNDLREIIGLLKKAKKPED
jgi:hypothetical protein